MTRRIEQTSFSKFRPPHRTIWTQLVDWLILFALAALLIVAVAGSFRAFGQTPAQLVDQLDQQNKAQAATIASLKTALAAPLPNPSPVPSAKTFADLPKPVPVSPALLPTFKASNLKLVGSIRFPASAANVDLLGAQSASEILPFDPPLLITASARNNYGDIVPFAWREPGPLANPPTFELANPGAPFPVLRDLVSSDGYWLHGIRFDGQSNTVNFSFGPGYNAVNAGPCKRQLTLTENGPVLGPVVSLTAASVAGGATQNRVRFGSFVDHRGKAVHGFGGRGGGFGASVDGNSSCAYGVSLWAEDSIFGDKLSVSKLVDFPASAPMIRPYTYVEPAANSWVAKPISADGWGSFTASDSIDAATYINNGAAHGVLIFANLAEGKVDYIAGANTQERFRQTLLIYQPEALYAGDTRRLADQWNYFAFPAEIEASKHPNRRVVGAKYWPEKNWLLLTVCYARKTAGDVAERTELLIYEASK